MVQSIQPHQATTPAAPTSQALLAHWWLLGVRGLAAMIFGALTLLMPGLTLLTLAALFAAFALVSGAVWTFGALRHRQGDRRWWLMLLLGVVSLAAGTIAMLHPAITTVVLIMLVGANALVTGVTDLVAAVRMRKIIHHEWLLALSGVASVLFGALVLLFPTGAGALALAAFIAVYALVTGALMVALALRLRSWRSGQQDGQGGAATRQT